MTLHWTRREKVMSLKTFMIQKKINQKQESKLLNFGELALQTMIMIICKNNMMIGQVVMNVKPKRKKKYLKEYVSNN